MARRPKRTDNGGPPLDDYEGPPWGKGDAYISLAWQAAHAKAWKAPCRDVMLMRLDKAAGWGRPVRNTHSATIATSKSFHLVQGSPHA
jgi:hypothetical protein